MGDGLWRDRVVWVLLFGVGAVAWGLLIGWNAWPIGGGLTVLVGTMARLRSRRPRRGTAEVVPDERGDWLARSSVEVKLAGSKQRYLATFSVTAPAVESADRHERRILETMRAVGMPPATLVALDASTPEEGDLVELPRRL
jgi:hypothetical protein